MSVRYKVSHSTVLLAFLWQRTLRYGCFWFLLGVMGVGWQVHLSDMEPLFPQQPLVKFELANGVVTHLAGTQCGYGGIAYNHGPLSPSYTTYRVTYRFEPIGSASSVTGLSYKTLHDASSWDDMKVQVKYDPANPYHSEMVSGESKPEPHIELLWLLIPTLGLNLIYKGTRTGRRRSSLLKHGCIVRGKLARATRARLLQKTINDSSFGEANTHYVPNYEYSMFNGYAFEFVTPEGHTYSAISNRTEKTWKGYLGENDPLLVMSNLGKQLKKIGLKKIQNVFEPEYKKMRKAAIPPSVTDELQCLDDTILMRMAQELGITPPDEFTGPVHPTGNFASATDATPEDYVIYDTRNPEDSIIIREMCPAFRITENGTIVCGLRKLWSVLWFPLLTLVVTVVTIYLRVRIGVI